MIGFLKNFFSGEKTLEEKALQVAIDRPRDVMTLDAYAMEEDFESDEDCSTPPAGCCGGGCRS